MANFLSDSASSNLSLDFYPLPGGVPSEAYEILTTKDDLVAKAFTSRHEKHLKEHKILVKYRKREWIQGGLDEDD